MEQEFYRHPNERAPSETHREAGYLRYLAQRQAPVSVKLRSGKVVRGFIEYYDRRFIRLTRSDGPNLFIFKSEIKYFYEEQPAPPERGAPPAGP